MVPFANFWDLTVKAHSGAVENNRLLVNDLVICSKTLLTLGHDGAVHKL